MNERTICIRLLQYVLLDKKHVAAIPNSTQLLWNETDLLSVTRAGLVHEFEIKCSKADYRREINGKSFNKKRKHKDLKELYSPNFMPNYFWFVTYQFDIEPPDYTGWIRIDGTEYGLQLRTKKEAPRLHSGKWDNDRIAKIARLLSFRLLKEYERVEDTVKDVTEDG